MIEQQARESATSRAESYPVMDGHDEVVCDISLLPVDDATEDSHVRSWRIFEAAKESNGVPQIGNLRPAIYSLSPRTGAGQYVVAAEARPGVTHQQMLGALFLRNIVTETMPRVGCFVEDVTSPDGRVVQPAEVLPHCHEKGAASKAAIFRTMQRHGILPMLVDQGCITQQ